MLCVDAQATQGSRKVRFEQADRAMRVLQGELGVCLSLVAQGSCKLTDGILVYTLLVERLSLLGVALEEAWLHFVRLLPCKSLQFEPCSINNVTVALGEWSQLDGGHRCTAAQD